MSLFQMKVRLSHHRSIGRNMFQKLYHLQEGILPDAHLRGEWIKTPSLLRSEPGATEINGKWSLIRELPCCQFRKLYHVCTIVTEQTSNCWMCSIVLYSNGSFMWLLSLLHHWILGVCVVSSGRQTFTLWYLFYCTRHTCYFPHTPQKYCCTLWF